MAQLPPPEFLTAKARKTRAALLDATRDVIGKDGVQAANVRAICTMAKVGRTSFYTYFDDVDSALAELATQQAEHIKAEFNRLHAQQSRGRDRLRACLVMIFELAKREPETVMFLTSIADSDSTVPALVQAEIQAEISDVNIAEHLTVSCLAIARGIAQGRIAPSHSSDHVDLLMRVVSP